MSAQDDGDSGFDPFFDGDEQDDEEMALCEECESELDSDDGTCPNELCAWYGVIVDGGPSDVELRQHERRQMGIDS